MAHADIDATDTARTDTAASASTAASPERTAPGIGNEAHTGAAAMYANDRASQHLGITLDDHGPGWAQCSMTVTDIMANGHEITHGGYIFLFADTTFAMACNYPGSVTVASGGDITFLKPTRVGDELVAHGRENLVLFAARLTQTVAQATGNDLFDLETFVGFGRGRMFGERGPRDLALDPFF